MEGAMVCRGAVLEGDVTVGAGSIVHTEARIIAGAGPIVIGEVRGAAAAALSPSPTPPPRQNCLVEEQVEIVNEREEPMVIGNWNAFEVPPPQRPSSGPRSSAAVQVGARCEAASIGNGNTLEARATVGPVRASPPPLSSPGPHAICLLRAQRWGTFASWAPAHRWGRWPRRLQTARWCTARPTPAASTRRASRPAEMVISLPSASRLARMAADWRRGAGRSDALEGELEVLRNGPLGTLKGGLKDFHPMLS